MDLVRSLNGEQQFFEDYRKLDSFREDPEIAVVVEMLQQELGQVEHQENLTLGGM